MGSSYPPTPSQCPKRHVQTLGSIFPSCGRSAYKDASTQNHRCASRRSPFPTSTRHRPIPANLTLAACCVRIRFLF
eukprot:scaffold41747_cov52-Phaeocystis_antarctica.AAC.3